MAVTVQQLLCDAKELVTRFQNHDCKADFLVSQAHFLSNSLEVMKEYHNEIEQLNGLAHQRPRSALILNIQQENRHIRALQQENRELRAMLEEHQSALDLIMKKYRQQVSKIAKAKADEMAWKQQDKTVELANRDKKISEMAAVIQKSIEIDDDIHEKEIKTLNKLVEENKMLRELLEIGSLRPVSLTTKLKIERTDECIQTED